MSERTSSATLNRPATAEQKRGNLAERVWQGTDSIVRGQLNQAALRIRDNGEQLSPERVVRLARATQERRLQAANTDDWTTGELTANRLGLVMLEMPFAAKAQEAQDQRLRVSAPELQERKNALIQFNHDLAETVAAMPSSMLGDLTNDLWGRTDELLSRLGLPIIPQERFSGIMNGISREVAFERALQLEAPEEWEFFHGTVEDDSKGIDITIKNGNLTLNLDLKKTRKV